MTTTAPDHHAWDDPETDRAIYLAWVFYEVTRTFHQNRDIDHMVGEFARFTGRDMNDDDSRTKLWGLAFTAPVVTAELVRKAAGIGRDDFFQLDMTNGVGSPSTLAAAQALTCHMNGDMEAAADVIGAHHAEHGLNGLCDFIANSAMIFSRAMTTYPSITQTGRSSV